MKNILKNTTQQQTLSVNVYHVKATSSKEKFQSNSCMPYLFKYVYLLLDFSVLIIFCDCTIIGTVSTIYMHISKRSLGFLARKFIIRALSV